MSLKYSHLHTAIVNDCTVKFNFRIFFCNFRSDTQKQTIRQFHDISFVNTCHFLSVVFPCKIKCVSCNLFRSLSCHYFQCFNNTSHTFMFQTWIFSFSILPDQHQIDVLMSSYNFRLRFTMNHIWNKCGRNLNTFLDLKFFECSLVSMFPFNATPFRFIETIASNKFSTFSCVESKWTSSKSTGNPPALKTI